jgi:UTP--glucose-1-phosphate uridylyltransferase
MKIRKAIIPVAGYGTRFLPATKAQPKEMLPIVDKPTVQYVVEELVAAGITDIIFVTRRGNHMLEDHFDSNIELERQLEAAGKHDKLKIIRDIKDLAHFYYVRQTRDMPYGNGTPLLAAKELIGDEPFVYVFPDDVVDSKVSATKQLIQAYEKLGNPAAIIGVQEMPPEVLHLYGVVKPKKGAPQKFGAMRLDGVVEKPAPGKAPSNLAQFGRFVLTPQVVEALAKQPLGKDNELWLTDALMTIAQKKPVYAKPIDGTWYTTGDPLNYLKTTIAFGLKHPKVGKDFAEYLRSLNLKDLPL